VSDHLFREVDGIHIVHGPGEAFAHLEYLRSDGVVTRTKTTTSSARAPTLSPKIPSSDREGAPQTADQSMAKVTLKRTIRRRNPTGTAEFDRTRANYYYDLVYYFHILGMRYYNKQPLRHMGNIPSMGAERYGTKTALVFRGDELTYEDLEARSNQVATGLASSGVEPSDRVGIYMENNLEFMALFFGIMKTGAVVVPLNFRRANQGTLYVLDDADVDVVIGSEHFVDDLADIHEEAGLERTYVSGGADRPGVEDYDAWISNYPESFDRPEREFDDIALQCYTSGTTGDPKGVLSSHRNLLTTLNAYDKLSGTDPETQTVLTIAPLFHMMGLMGSTMTNLYAGGTIVMRNLPEPEALLEAITEYEVTSFSAVPAIYTDMINQLEENPEEYDVSSIESLGTGAAPLARDTRERIESAFGVPLTEGWGMTETSPAGTANFARGVQKGAGCIGQPVPDLQMKLVDPETRETRVPWEHLDPKAPADLTGFEPDFEHEETYTGEIAIRGPNVFEGYHKLDEITEEVFDEEGWFYTEDIARVDEDRYLWMIDRADDMMIVGGENVYPAEIEDELFFHSDIKEAAVVAAKHEVKGEAPVAYIVTEEGADPSEEEIRRYALEQVPTYAHPRRVFFIDELPRSGTDKVQRFKLEERVEDDIEGDALKPSEEL